MGNNLNRLSQVGAFAFLNNNSLINFAVVTLLALVV